MKADYQAAIMDYNQSIAHKADYGKAYFNRGVAKFSIKDYQNTIIDLEKATQLGLEDKEIFRYLGLAQFEVKEFAEAEEILSQVLKSGYDDQRVYYSRGISRYYLAEESGKTAGPRKTETHARHCHGHRRLCNRGTKPAAG